MGKQRNSKARLVIEITGPTEGVQGMLDHLTKTQLQQFGYGVQVSYPEPCTVQPHVRARKAKGAGDASA